MQKTFQKYKQNENIPEFPSDDIDEGHGELQSVSVQDGGEKQNLLSGEDDWNKIMTFNTCTRKKKKFSMGSQRIVVNWHIIQLRRQVFHKREKSLNEVVYTVIM